MKTHYFIPLLLTFVCTISCDRHRHTYCHDHHDIPSRSASRNYDSNIEYLNINCQLENISQPIHVDVLENYAITCYLNNTEGNIIENPIFNLMEPEPDSITKTRKFFLKKVEYSKGKISVNMQEGIVDHTLKFFIDDFSDGDNPGNEFRLNERIEIKEGDVIDIIVKSPKNLGIDTFDRISNSRNRCCSDVQELVINPDYICRTILTNI